MTAKLENNPTIVSTAELTQLRFFAKQLALPPKKRVSSSQAGGYLSSIRGRGMEFEEVRQYQPGDDIRLMDWRVTARTGTAHTKIFRDERERPIVVVTDFSASMYFGTQVTFKSCVAAKAACLLGWAAIQNGDRIGGMLYHENEFKELRPTGGQRGIFNLINQVKLAANSPPKSDASDLATLLRQLRRVSTPGTMIFVISDFWAMTEAAEQELNHLTQHNDVFCIMVSDPIELKHLPSGQYPVQVEQQAAWLDLASRKKCHSLQTMLDQRVSELQDFCRKRRINFLQLSTADEIAASLIKQMGRRTAR